MQVMQTCDKAIMVVGAMSALGVCGCTAPDVTSAPPIEMRDSAGVTIVTTNGSLAREPLEWSVDSVPNLVIGREGEAEYEFNQVQGVEAFEDGRILVVDAGSAELRFYGDQGQFLARVGRRGSGPGEFQQPMLVPRAGPDRVLIFDSRLNRFTFVTLADYQVDVVTPPTRVMGTPLGFVGGRSLMRNAPLAIGGIQAVQPASRATFVLIDPATGAGDTIAAYDGPQLFSTPMTGDGPRFTTGVLFKIFPSGAVSTTGAVLHGAKGPELVVSDSAGRSKLILRVAESRTLVTDEVVAGVATRLGSGAGDGSLAAEMKQLYDQMPLPDTLPAFHRLLVDEEGWIWAEIYRPERDPLIGPLDPSVEALWMVFDQDGVGRGTVTMPQDIYVHQIGREFVLGVGKDRLGVETIRRYGLRRP